MSDLKNVFAGVDIGSNATKSVVLADGKIAGYSLIQTGVKTEENGLVALEKALDTAGLKRDAVRYIVATGYGRISAPYADKTVTEITCHAKGANFLYPNVKTIIDIGGQDCKAIRLDADGNVIDFAMNDKCAAGTGRFLEVMANILKVKLADLGELSFAATEIVPMSSTCTVFVESETISLIARGEKPANIIRGVHHAIGNRVSGLFSRVGVESDVFISGGVAKNAGMRLALEEALQVRTVEPSFDPQLTGALGAAVLAKFFAAKEQLS